MRTLNGDFPPWRCSGRQRRRGLHHSLHLGKDLTLNLEVLHTLGSFPQHLKKEQNICISGVWYVELGPLGPSSFFLQKEVASGGSNLAHLGELGGKLLPYFAINRRRSEEERGSAFLALLILSKLLRKIISVKSLDVTSLKELGRLMGPLQRQAFRKVYRKILDLTATEVFTEAVVSLAQYYDQPLRCFTFGDFQIVPIIEEFEEILGCPLGGRKPYLFSGFLPSLNKIAAVVGDSAKELDRMKQTRNGVVGLPRKYLEGKARDMASQDKWGPFADILALLIFGVVLFPNVDGLVDLAAIDAFLAYHHSKESPVVAILADLFDTFDRRCEENSARIVCCLPALCVWLVSHLFQQDTRHPCPLQSYRSCAEKGRVGWDQHLAGIGGSAINWFPRWKEGKEGVLFSCGDYPNVPLKVIQRVHKAWRSPLRKDKELRGIRSGVIGDWFSKLKVIDEENFEASEEDEEVRALKLELGKARLAKEKFKSAATHIRKECTELQEENAASAIALEQETKRARKEEHGRKKFRGALWGSNNELKLRREERDWSRVHGMILWHPIGTSSRRKHESIKEYAQRWRDLIAQVIPLMTEREMITIMVDTLPTFYYEKLIGYIPANFADLVFAGERIESGLRKGKFEYASNVAPNNNRRAPVVGARKKEGDAHAVTIAPTWMKAPQNIQSLYQPNPPNFSIRAESSLPTQVKGPPAAERTPTQRTAPATPRPCPLPKDNFSPIPMAYSELWLSLLENHLVVAIHGRVFQRPYPRWYDPGAKCEYHSGAPRHNIDSCLPFRYKVQHLISAGWLSFQEEGPNVKTNLLASHGGASVNAVEEDGPSRAKRLGEVATSRRFIYQSLQAACMVSCGGDERDECLFHLGESHDMETCPAVEELLQWLMDWGQLEVSKGGKEEPHICMQSEEKKVPLTPKALVICFTRKETSSTPVYPRTVPKPMPFAYQSNKVVPWKYTPLAFSERVATEVDSLNGFEPGMGLGKDSLGNADVVDVKGNPYKYGLGYEPGMPGRRNVLSRFRADRVWPGRLSQSFTSAGMVSEEEVAAVGEEFPQDPPNFVQPCHPDSQVGNWRVISQSEVYTEMAPRKLASKRSRKDKAVEGTSSAPEYDSHRFRSAEHQQRFEAIRGWSFLQERRVQLRDDEYTDFQEEIARRRWASLVTPMAMFDPDIVLEFYANAWPTKEGVRDMRSSECEYGQRRNRADGFDEEAIAQLLCIPGQDFARTAAGRRVRIMRTNMTTLTQIWMTLLLSNIQPSDHNSDLPLPKCQLVYAILTRMSIHVAQLIADAIYLFAGLCQSFGVPVAPSKVIRPPITRAFIEKYCTQRQAQGDARRPQTRRHLIRLAQLDHLIRSIEPQPVEPGFYFLSMPYSGSVQGRVRPTWAFQFLPPEGGCFWRKQPCSPGRAGCLQLKRKGSSSTAAAAGHRRHGPSEAPTTPIHPSLLSPRSSTLFSSDDQRLRYLSQFSSRIILDPKYLDIDFFNDETFDCYQVDFMSLKLPYYLEHVKVFYCNLKIQDGILSSEVHVKVHLLRAPLLMTGNLIILVMMLAVCRQIDWAHLVRKRSFTIGAGAVTSFGYHKDQNGQRLKKDALPPQDERTPSPPPQRDDSTLMTEVLFELRGLRTYVAWKHEFKESFHCPQSLSSQKIKSFSELNCLILSKRFLGQPLAYSIRNFDWSSLYNLSLLREISSSLLLISEKGLRDRGSLVLAQASQVASSRSNSLLEESSGGSKWAWVLFAPPFLLSTPPSAFFW
ncbi:hypothetical protein HKD37_07G019647 [Glycine soja]